MSAELVLTAHHVLFDGWSVPLLMRDLLRLYAADGTARSDEIRLNAAQIPKALRMLVADRAFPRRPSPSISSVVRSIE